MTDIQKQAIPKAKPGITPRGPQLVLYGGGFDPVHNAHLAIARRVLGELPDAELCFIPAAHSPLKDGEPAACDADRIAMLERALLGFSNCLIDDLEIRRGGRSYTVDTVTSYREMFPDIELFWVLGADQFVQLDRWHAIEQLKAMVTFLVVGRPDFPDKTPVVPGLSYRWLELPVMPHSSTEVRRRCREGLPLSGLVPAEVEAFILQHRLYSSKS